MKRILYLLILIVFGTTSCVQNKEYNYDIDYLHGNVKAIKYSTFSAKIKFGEAVKDEKEWSVMYHFNEQHQIGKIIDYDLDGNLSYVTKCKYDSYGNLSSLSKYNSKGEVKTIIEFEYNDGRVTKGQAYSCYGDEKDEEGDLKISYFNNGITITFDDTRITYNVEPKSHGKISRIRYSENEQTTVTIVRDKDGNIIKTTNSTEPMFDDPGHPIFYTIIVRTPYSTKTDDYLYEYEFDEQHNWTKKIIYKNDLDHPVYICTREIEYYE